MSNQTAFDEASTVIPGGVNSPVRAFRSVGGAPRFLVSGHGPYVVDVEGREYVDLVCSWGPLLLGHAHPQVLDAVHQAVSRGLSFGASTPAETELAEAVIGELVEAQVGLHDEGIADLLDHRGGRDVEDAGRIVGAGALRVAHLGNTEQHHTPDPRLGGFRRCRAQRIE
jgi:hypothetical protein